jgi:hypothetical protein
MVCAATTWRRRASTAPRSNFSGACKTPDRGRSPKTATQVTYHFASGDVRVEIIPETSKLNVNRATVEVLTRLGMALGLDEARAGALAQSIDQFHRPGGGGAAGIGAAPSFPSAGASLQEIEELLSVPGVTPELFYGTYVPQQDAEGKMQLSRRAGLVDCLTVYGRAQRRGCEHGGAGRAGRHRNEPPARLRRIGRSSRSQAPIASRPAWVP